MYAHTISQPTIDEQETLLDSLLIVVSFFLENISYPSTDTRVQANMKRGTDVDESKNQEDDGITPLCASCDRCRARKTRCDGQRPCSNCCAKYMKTHKLTR
jgi:hypothetical protein